MERNRLALLTEFLQLTRSMVAQRDQEDMLLAGMEQRQSLMEAYQTIQAQGGFAPMSSDEKETLTQLAKEIATLDQIIAPVLEDLHRQAKAQLSSSNHQQKILGYVNQSLSPSGSYLDLKK